MTCQFCVKYEHNAKRNNYHLYSCEPYLKDPTNAQSRIARSTIRASVLTQLEETTLRANTINHFGLIQTQIAVPALRKFDQAALDEIASMALYVGGWPLNLFDEPWMEGVFFSSCFTSICNPLGYDRP